MTNEASAQFDLMLSQQPRREELDTRDAGANPFKTVVDPLMRYPTQKAF
ncbi:MAG: hypothetical protein HC904_00160 [Blastochloris sp.]|nr:hypothetical protein [Blastochloris sp.]